MRFNTQYGRGGEDVPEQGWRLASACPFQGRVLGAHARPKTKNYSPSPKGREVRGERSKGRHNRSQAPDFSNTLEEEVDSCALI